MSLHDTQHLYLQKDVIRVDLKKPPGSNLGLSLIQGEKCNTSALLVRNLTPDGIAAIDGRLKVGDRLLQVRYSAIVFQRSLDSLYVYYGFKTSFSRYLCLILWNCR